MDIDDRSIDYLANDLKKDGRQSILERELKKDTLEMDQLLRPASEHDVVIEKVVKNLYTDAGTRYSTISLHYVQGPLLKKEMVANDNLARYRPSVARRFGEAFSYSSSFFFSMMVTVVYVSPFLLLGIGLWKVFPYVQRKLKV